MSSEPAPRESVSTSEPSRVERILNAALKTFAARGTEATSLRMIAAAAGVSLGLVQHHFVTKANLIQAVDDHVTAVLTASLATTASAPDEDPVADIANRVTSLLVDHGDVVDYLCRALVDATPTGTRVFDTLVAVAGGHWAQLQEQGLAKPDLDPVWMTLNPLVLVLGMFILRAQLNRHLPEPLTSPTEVERWRNATEQIIADGQLRRPPGA
ncbi:TetR/AcrR family transcriptional regulator [Mycobacterium sp. Marseille-P9652]|uniref:TetR/AcrR family transcriptional regulator n=1 Tax=Mycobacterium sp. Marseille-P9652 TaxID=2654950 RepID=UPI0012E7DBEC|nr:TetR/AcrR family transcriptional regulator [Mycobacterium sp. Marseille-P9652]